MRGSITIVLLLILCMGFSAHAQWISFDKSSALPQSPKVKLLKSNSEGVLLEVSVTGVMVEDVTSKNEVFKRYSFKSGTSTQTVGAPEVPYISEILAIPNEASVSYEVLEMSDFEVFNDVLLPPSRPSWLEGESEPEYEIVESAYRSSTTFPKDAVKIEDPAIFRDLRIARVGLYPAQYDANKKELKIAKRMKVKVTFGEGETVNKKETPDKKIAPSFGAIYRSTILNYEQVLEENYNGREDGEEVLLLITPDNFYDQFEEFIQWKIKSGFKVIVTKFSDIGATSTNPITIYNHIVDLYNNSENPPTYVTIVGDAEEFPYKIAVYSDYSFPDEDYFVKVAGDDFIPDMFIGRISVQTSTTLDVILDKFLNYEQNPYMEDNDWFTSGICCSNNAYESQVTTKEFTAEIMRNDGNFTLVNEYMSDGDWDHECTYGLVDVIQALNEGRSFLNYRGEGWTTGWYASCTPFQIEDLDYLQNGRMYPFVTSIGCGVAMFDNSGGNSFGERWLKMGTISNPRGAINFVGPTSNTHTTYNNYLDKGIYIGLFQEGLHTPGQALLRGKMNVYNQFGVEDYKTEYQFRVYCSLGDPSTRLWKEVPQYASVSYPSVIDGETQSVSVYVGNIDMSSHMVNANISGANFSMNAKVDNSNFATFYFTPTEVETLTLTVTGTGMKPFIGSIQVQSVGIGDMNTESQLVKNIPNPFSETTEINYNISKSSDAYIAIYDVSGKLVRVLESGYKVQGNYTITWDGKNDAGANVISGVYLLTLRSLEGIETIRLLKMN
jgi:hypothetical protein